MRGTYNICLIVFRNEITRIERSKTIVSVSEEDKEKPKATASALLSKSTKSPKCVLCKKSNHTIDKCFNLTRISTQERYDLLKKNGICFKCLSKDKHSFRNCNSVCKNCNKAHHFLLCDTNKKSHDNANPSLVSASTNNTGTQTDELSHDTNYSQTGPVTESRGNNPSLLASSIVGPVLLQVAKVKVNGNKGVFEANVLFDTGADRSYVSQDLVKRVGPKWLCTQKVACATFGNKNSNEIKCRNVFSLDLTSSCGNSEVILTEVPNICAALSKPKIPRHIF